MKEYCKIDGPWHVVRRALALAHLTYCGKIVESSHPVSVGLFRIPEVDPFCQECQKLKNEGMR